MKYVSRPQEPAQEGSHQASNQARCVLSTDSTDTGRHAGKRHNSHRLAHSRSVCLDFFVNVNIEFCCADHALSKDVMTVVSFWK